MDEFGQRGCAAFGLRPVKPARQASTACASSNATSGTSPQLGGVPPKRRPPDPPRIVDEQKDELECVREANEVEFGSCRERDRRVAGVKRTAKPAAGGALRGHEQMLP
jgi:hypothetical protein